MSNVVKFPRSETKKTPQAQQPQHSGKPAGNEPSSDNMTRNISQGVLSALYIVLITFWTPVKIILALNVVLQAVKMMIHWHESPFAATWPFILSFAVLTGLMYIVATWKPGNLKR